MEQAINWQQRVDTGIYPPRVHLFLDDLHIEALDSVERRAHSPAPVTEGPVMMPERPWEGQGLIFRNGVIYDDEMGLFRFWYPCHDRQLPDTPVASNRRWAYAVSEDGVTWERPSLGLVAFEGSKDNNLIQFENMDEVVGLLWTVVIDRREEDPAKRYKGIGLDRHARRPGEISWTGSEGEDEWYENHGRHLCCGLFVGYSSDGLSWRLKETWAASGALMMDGSTLHGWNERIKKWVLWQRPRIIPKYRTIGVSYSEDFENWTFPELVITPDENDPPQVQFDMLTSMEASDGGYIGMLSVSGYGGLGFDAALALPELVYSRDGTVWTRVQRRPLIEPLTDGEAWNDGCIMPCNPIQRGDEVFVFYYGKNRGRTWGDPTLDGKRMTTSGLGLATLQRDRWVSIGSSGSLRTRLVSFSHNELHVNADASGGALRAALLDFEGKPIAGFTESECEPLSSDSLDHTLRWAGTADLSEIIGTARRQPRFGRGLKVRFVLEKAHLYSFSC